MNKTTFILPLPIEIQFEIFKYEHVIKFKPALKNINSTILNELKNVCFICKCAFNTFLKTNCTEYYVYDQYSFALQHYTHKQLEDLNYHTDNNRKIIIWYRTLSLRPTDIKMKYVISNKIIQLL